MPKVQSISHQGLRTSVALALTFCAIAATSALAKPAEAPLTNPACVFQPEADALTGAATCTAGTQECKAQKFAQMLEGIKCKAFSGDGEAAYMLGKMYLHGIHVEPDASLVSRFWRLAAKNGHPVAQHDFAMYLLTEGGPVAERVEEALYWLGTSASGGHAMSAVVLGRIYEVGWYDVSPDPCLALIWYEAGAMMGTPPPQERVGKVSEQASMDCR
ncbi:MAG: tetratricopeptide repeat protein [Pseudomonadota bacterium]